MEMVSFIKDICNKFYSTEPKKLKNFRKDIISAAHSTDKLNRYLINTSKALFELHDVKKSKNKNKK